MKNIFYKTDYFINKFGFLLLILYKLFLDIIYLKIIVPIFNYSGFNVEFNIYNYVIYWMIFIIFYPFIKFNYNKKKPSNAVITILYLVAFIPGLVLQGFMHVDINMRILFLLYWIMIVCFNFIIPSIKLKKVSYKIGILVTNIIITYFSFVIIYISYKYTGFRLNFNLFNVYTLREEALNFQLPSILSYSFAAAKVFLPIAFVYMISENKKKYSYIIFLIQFLAFSIDGSKSTLFSILLVFLCYKLYKGTPNKIFVTGSVLISILALMEYLLLKSYYLVNFIVRRLLFLPNLLHIFYFDFFKNNELDYFRQGIIGRLGFDSPYNSPIPNIIGGHYFNADTMIANNGLFSDAFYNLGTIGILVLPIFIIIALRYLDACSEGLNCSILISVIITSSYTFISSSFFTVMLTHGFLITCIGLIFIPRKEPKINMERNLC